MLVELAPYLLIALLALAAGIFGGVSGYGTGLILPPFLLPITGPEPIVPIITISALLINLSRASAYRSTIDWRRMRIVVLSGLPSCLLGAYLYAGLSGTAVTVLIGGTLIALVPLRRLASRANWHLGDRGLVVASLVYGLIVGSTAGSGVVLITIMLASGIGGAAVVATDAVISIAMGGAKLAVFQASGTLNASTWIMAALIGLSAAPGAYIARRLTLAMPVHMHVAILDGVVVFGGGLLILQAVLG